MKRLFSFYGLYAVVFGWPFFCVVIIITAYVENEMPMMILVVLTMLYWLFTFRRWKRVYYDADSLYIYDIFSNNHIVVHKRDIGGVNRIMTYDPRFYKIVYYDVNNDAKYVNFQRNWFLSDFGEIIDKLNG